MIEETPETTEETPDRISLEEVFQAFLEEDDPQTLEMVLFRVAEHVIHRNPSRDLSQLLRQLGKATDLSARAHLELDPDQKAHFEYGLKDRLLRAWYMASGENPE